MDKDLFHIYVISEYIISFDNNIKFDLHTYLSLKRLLNNNSVWNADFKRNYDKTNEKNKQ